MSARRARIAGSLLALAAVAAGPAQARFRVEVTKAPGFAPAALTTVAVVAGECHQALNCRRVEREVAAELTRARPEVRVVVGDPVHSQLLALGHERYASELREPLAKALAVDLPLELGVPHGAPGMVSVRRTEVTLTMRLVRPSGELLFIGEGTGRPLNTLSSPEKAAGEVAERIFEEALAP